MAVPVSGDTSIDLTHVDVLAFGCMNEMGVNNVEGETLIQHIRYAGGERQAP